MKTLAAIKKAYAREAMVTAAKGKKVEDLTFTEAKEIIKWDREASRNTVIALVGMALTTAFVIKK